MGRTKPTTDEQRDAHRGFLRPPPNGKEDSRWGFRGMTVRNWLELLVVPLVLVGIGLLFETQQADRQRAMEEQQQLLEQRRAEAEQELAEQRARDEALQAYLDQMSTLLLERDLRDSESGSEPRTLARARTLTVLSRLDPSRKTMVAGFLQEAELIQGVEGKEPIIDLNGANLSGIKPGPLFADLSGAYLVDANLTNADLSYGDLDGAALVNADLGDADLEGADLSGGAILYNADLGGANLEGADLSDAILDAADLSGARGVTEDQLAAAASLDKATMPNGQNYEEWLEDR